ncbi:Reverse transcriptase domain-containing protein [Durusdinium trenchii]|uniref:Reverse transcriptase domain-containing protein n=1 Tax=Durusdinium trenchii TaxID=1381693 RepID=A0ABP0I1C2_9DINO
MDVWVVLITTVLVWGSLHLRFTRKDWANLRRWASMERQVVDALKEARVKEEMVKLRQRHCRLLNRCFSHIVFVTSLGLLHQALTAPGLDTITWASVGIISYLPMAVVGQDSLSVTPAQLKLITWFLHFLQLPLIASSICSATAFDFAVRQGLQTVSRFGLGILFLDPWVSIPFQLVHSAAEFAVHLSYFEMNRVHMGLLLIAQFFTFAIHIACMAFIDVVLRQRINAQLETADAESLVSSFRRMLRSVCDGEVLLDGQMNVAQESEGLKHLILTTVNLKGRSFERLLIDEECTRFTKFIQSSTEAFLTPKPAVPPVCLRTSLRGSAGIRVAADVFHVPIPGLFGAAEPYHLLAFKEDTESRAHPEANEDSVPAELLSRQPRQAHRPGSRPGSTSMLSGSTGRSSCHGFPGLDEVFLLIDVDSQLQEVTQVELNFKRDRCAASMPSLGKLVRPSEWEKVRSSVARFAEKSSRDQSDHPKVLKRLTLQVPGQSGWMLVDEATLHRSQQPWKLWMHLHGFHPR